MERPELEKLLKKLEALDIREWRYNDCILTAEVCGMQFNILSGKKYYTRLVIKNVENKSKFEAVEYFDSKETKPFKKVIESFYKKTYESLLEYENKQLTEKLDTYLSD